MTRLLIQAVAHSLGLQLHVLHASTDRDFDTAFATLLRLRASALIIGADAFFINQSEQLGALALRHAVRAISFYRDFVAAGGLMGYGGDLADAFRLRGVYSGRILNGEKPANLPVQQETKFALIINLKTAKALGLTIPFRYLAAPTRRSSKATQFAAPAKVWKWHEADLPAAPIHVRSWR